MVRAAVLLALGLALSPAHAAAREAVWASEPQHVSVTIYRDPDRLEDEEIERDWPRGFALISEKRTVTLPAGQTTIRFDGVAEGMIAVSAIVTGLPGGTIEKNRNADLLSPASLLDGTLGNRITVTRTHPATGAQVSEDGIVRTRADGALVLQTRQGYEAVRCAGIPETLTFDRVPDGLSARPVYSIDTRDPRGGTYEIVLTYLSWGFDWQAHYVADFDGRQRDGTERLALRSWLTLVNDNGQSFENAEVMAVAGKLNIVSDYAQLADPPDARGLYLQCYPLGSTATGSSAYDMYPPPPPAPPPAPGGGYYDEDAALMVTGARFSVAEAIQSIPAVMIAREEQLGDLKLYRIPEPVTVAAKSMKQVVFLDKDEVEGELFYRSECVPDAAYDEPESMRIVLETVNDEKHGLGAALPMGGVTLFERGFLVGEESLRDHAEGQDVEIDVAQSTQVFATCTAEQSEIDPFEAPYPWAPFSLTISNANPEPVKVKVRLGHPVYWRMRDQPRGVVLEDGYWTLTRTIAANRSEKFGWSVRYISDEEAAQPE